MFTVKYGFLYGFLFSGVVKWKQGKCGIRNFLGQNVTGKVRYGDYYAEFMEYLDETVLDHEKGSWFHQLDEHNQVIGTVWPGKSDLYHAFQATLIPYYSPAVSIAAAVKRGEK